MVGWVSVSRFSPSHTLRHSSQQLGLIVRLRSVLMNEWPSTANRFGPVRRPIPIRQEYRQVRPDGVDADPILDDVSFRISNIPILVDPLSFVQVRSTTRQGLAAISWSSKFSKRGSKKLPLLSCSDSPPPAGMWPN